MSWLDRTYLAPGPARRLLLFRLLVGAYAGLYLLVRAPALLATAAFPSGRFAPIGVWSGLHAPLPVWLFAALLAGTIVSAVAFALGRGGKAVPPLLAASLWLTLTYRNCWGMIFHTENLLVLHAAALACAPAAARPFIRRGRDPDPAREDAASGWPLRLCAAITAGTYLVAGVAKLRGAGLSWVTSDILRNYVAWDNLRKIQLGDWHSPVGAFLVGHDALFPLLAGLSLAMELGAPLALLGPRAWALWSAAAWSFHAGVLATMAILFPYPLLGLAYAPMLPLERMEARALELTRRWRSPAPSARRTP